jgi:O-acetyl-ADP-ribose deacetylase (regulator of RNase III)
MKKVHGDLLSLAEGGKFDVIIHGCNCFHIMGGGIAKSVKDKFPAAYQADLQTQRGSPEKLGTYTFAIIDVECEGTTVVVKKNKSPPSPGRKRSLLKMINRISSDSNNNNNNSSSNKNGMYHHSLTIVNAYTQYRLGNRDENNGQINVQVNYDAVRLAFRNIKQQFTGKRLAYPKIGAGLAGGDWNIISQIIDEELDGEDHTLCVFQL